jgi:hypothetical protein
VNGSYLASRVRGDLSGPLIAFREYFFRDVLPAFADLDARAAQVGDDFYSRVDVKAASEHGMDMADIPQNAQERSYDWWGMMTSLRQTMLNLTAAGLFHLIEQQLATLSRDGLFRGEEPLRDTNIKVVQSWYLDHFGIDLAALPSWRAIDEMRLVANTVKHGEGGSAKDLRATRPELFTDDPEYAELLRQKGLGGDERQMGRERLTAPLSGEDFFVTEEILRAYAKSAEAFFGEIAAALDNRERKK